MAGGITVAVVGTKELAGQLAKKSTTSDLALYHQVQGDRYLTVVEPAQYPEKFVPLLYSLGMGDRAVFAISALDRYVAETAATLDLFDLPVDVRLGAAVGAEEIGRAFRGLRLAKLPAAPLDLVKLREELATVQIDRPAGPVSVVLDHYFPVKGVGTVALGFVQGGPLVAHAQLRLYPTEKMVELRSVQVHDVDVKEAAPGDRVGVALKGAEVDELARGQVLAPPGALQVSTALHGAAGRRCAYYRGDLVAGAQLHALVGLTFVPVSVTEVAADRIQVEADRPVAWKPGAPMVLADLSVPQGPRCVGRWDLSGTG